MITIIVISAIVIYLLAYKIYGGLLSKWLKLDNSRKTPAHEINDGIDYVPAKAPLLLGQHFSAIAAAGPIVGPILATIWFGWLPAILWIILGAIFIGGVHDFTSLVASIRHKAASIGSLVKQNMSPTSHILFLIFMWITLMYVIIAFTDITAHTFMVVSSGEAFGPGVAITSLMYLLLSVAMGIVLYKFKLNLWITTAIFIPLVLLAIWAGPHMPASVINMVSLLSAKEWNMILLAYCFIASIIPMWLLLQPRGYLGGWMLYLTIAASIGGALFGGFTAEYPAVNLVGLKSLANGKSLFPILFITIACGACSGFHGIASSGTTSKQLFKETDAKPIGYGAMLLEGLVAILAIATVMILSKDDALLKSDPNLIYANGIAKYMGLIGINFNIAFSFALLAFSTFVYDTLDVSTRLARYIFQELTGWKGLIGGAMATIASLLLPIAFLLVTKEKGYLVAWPIFGTSNQLLASLILLAISVWFIKSGKNAMFAILPMIFMMVMTLWSLVKLTVPFLKSITANTISSDTPDVIISGVVGIVLFVLAIWLICEAVNILWLKRK